MGPGQGWAPGASIPPRLDAPPAPPSSTVDADAPWQDISPKARRRELSNRLAELADQLGGAYNGTVERLEREMPHAEPFQVTDTNGQPVLAPMLSALGNVLAALAALELADR